jgi:hypothetical protein
LSGEGWRSKADRQPNKGHHQANFHCLLRGMQDDISPNDLRRDLPGRYRRIAIVYRLSRQIVNIKRYIAFVLAK